MLATSIQESYIRLLFEGNDKRLLTKDPFVARTWDLDYFKMENLPIVVGTLEAQLYFTVSRGVRVLDMPIKMPGTDIRFGNGDIAAIAQEAVLMAAIHETAVAPGGIDDYYCYITIDQKPVSPFKSQRRPGWHSDAYIVDDEGVQLDVIPENKEHIEKHLGRLVDRTYICYDILPTKFLPGPFPLDGIDANDCDEVLASFDEMAAGQDPITYPPYTVLCLDPYDVHAAATNPTMGKMQRTFIKISFSKERFNREGNTHNDAFDYKWTMVPRADHREHRYAKV